MRHLTAKEQFSLAAARPANKEWPARFWKVCFDDDRGQKCKNSNQLTVFLFCRLISEKEKCSTR